MIIGRRLLAAGLLALLAAADLGAAQNQRTPWWRSDELKKELGLTADQSARIDQIHETTLPELRQEWDELQRLEAKLAKTIETSNDEGLLARQIDRVETARANLNKTRQLMLARMRLVLTPEQRARFSAVVDRETAKRGGDSRKSGAPSTSGPGRRDE
jgi:Spy/CpxP family protein refolding chaperone